jgi:hypothetical protein
MQGEEHHVVSLRSWLPMVEVEYDDVSLAAVDARVCPEIFTD